MSAAPRWTERLAAAPPRTFIPPARLDPTRVDDEDRLDALLAGGHVREVHDTIDLQLEELVRVRHPQTKLSRHDVDVAIERELAGLPRERYGRWIHQPWSGRLVHVLPEPAFREVRHARNRHKITADEQRVLGEAIVGVVGLSVGRASAVTLAMEGVGGRFRLADPDTLSLSNLNRLRSGLHGLGVGKATLAAEEILEIDPYLDVEPWERGVTAGDAEAFLCGAGGDAPLSLLVEECDSLPMKLVLREHARRLGVPVVMETSDRGMLDVERFDLDPSRRPFHGLIGDLRPDDLASTESQARLGAVARIVGGPTISARAGASLFEIGATIDTWPQLASAVALGAAIVTDVARRILLGSFTDSGRFYVDLERAIANGAGEVTADMDAPAPPERVARIAPSRGAPRPITPDLVRELVRLATLAPSAHNYQPWRFEARGARIACHIDPARCLHAIDPTSSTARLAVGSAVENLVLGAEALGVDASITIAGPGQATLVCTVDLHAGRAPRASRLASHIERRTTNRRAGDGTGLSADEEARLRAATGDAGGSLRVLGDAAGKAAIAACIGEADRVTFLHPTSHRELFRGFRWTPNEARAEGDGLDMATLELPEGVEPFLRVLARDDVAAALRAMGGGRKLVDMPRDQVVSAAAVVVVTVPRSLGHAAFFHGGRALERFWLEATALGLAVHPMSTLPYLRALLDAHGGGAFEGAELDDARRACDLYRAAFDLGADVLDVNLLRVSHAEPARVRSLRRPLEHVLAFEDA